MKKALLFLVLFALLGLTSAWAYDFSAVAPSGQTLYYRITSSTPPYTVNVTCPSSYSWYGHTKPTGALTIPSSVTYSGRTYSVTSIGDYAFYDCDGLTSVTIPDSVTSIGTWTFDGCTRLRSLVVQTGNTVYDSRNSCNAIIETATNTLIIGTKSTIIPNSVTSIGTWAFSGCSSLTSIRIPNSVTEIGNFAFWNCSGLTSVTIPNSVTSIGSYAFRGCSGLQNLPISSSIREIQYHTYEGCTNIWVFTIPNSVTAIGNGAFKGCIRLKTATIPNTVTTIGQEAFMDCAASSICAFPTKLG